MFKKSQENLLTLKYKLILNVNKSISRHITGGTLSVPPPSVLPLSRYALLPLKNPCNLIIDFRVKVRNNEN